MAHTKSAGSTTNIRDSQPKYRGVKIHDGDYAKVGCILVRQTGSKVLAGAGVKRGRDFTLYAVEAGMVKFTNKRKLNFDGNRVTRKMVSIVPGT
jgi:large subunit ribosomal protein L27